MSEHNDEKHEHYVAPLSQYYKTFGALIALTVITVLTSMYDFGVMNIVIAMIIASIKAMLVIMFFMQLKYDGARDKVTFASGFIFFAIFVILTASDIFFRHKVEPLKVEKVAGAGLTEGEITDENVLRIATPALVKKGKEIFDVQCVMCHGANGKGDGPAAVALNPKPRDFTSGYWKMGGAPTQIFHTLTVGIPGSAMSSFSSLSIQDRYSLVAYVRTFHPGNPEDTPATLKAAGLLGGVKKEEAPKVELPIEVAMSLVEEPDQVVIPTKAPAGHSTGGDIFNNKCARCHGLAGEGAAFKALGINPQVNLITKSFKGSASVANQNEFVRIVSEGYPGHTMPNVADLSKQEWSELYSYVRQLAQ